MTNALRPWWFQVADHSMGASKEDSSQENDDRLDDSLPGRLERGESQAMEELFEKYSPRLQQIATQNIQSGLKRRFDGEDVVQSVFRTFFRRQKEEKLRVEHSEQLWRLLVRITLCKTRSRARQHTARRRDARADKAIGADWELLAQPPSPEDAIALQEEVDAALEGLPERAGEILSKRFEGETKSDIARQLNLSRQTIHRILKLVETRLTERLERYVSEGSESHEK